MNRNEYLENIKKVIKSTGYYLTSVIPCPQPGFVYTIGLTNSLKFELVFCGTANYELRELQEIVDKIQEKLSQGLTIDQNFDIENFGNFTLRQTDATWNEKILLGVFDIFDVTEIAAYQIVPEEKNKLLDIPDMSEKWDPKDSIWRWMDDEWTYPIPEGSIVATNLAALKGESITEVTRWEEDEWDMYVGASQDVPEEEIRIVPFATMLGIDKSLEAAINLQVEKGLWRENGNDPWENWEEEC